MKKKSTQKKDEKNFKVINPKAAGIDVGSMLHYVAVPVELSTTPVRKFGSFTSDLEAIAAWLTSIGVSTVAMESTGNYWIPLYDVLQSKGLEVYLVNARHVKNVSGRKTDISDCQWLQKLHTFGLLSASFIPEEQIRKLRSYVRQRNNIEVEKAKDLQHIQRSLTNMNVKLQHLVSDIEGVTAMKIIQDIASGVTDAKILAGHRTAAMKASKEEIEKSLEGNYSEEHLFTMIQALESYYFHLKQMKHCDEKIEFLLSMMSSSHENNTTFETRTKKRKSRKNQYQFDLKSYLIELLGVNLTEIDGIDESTVLEVISETGTDLSKWRTAKHFTSWLKLCPNPAISGGKVLGNKGSKTSSRAAKAFRLAARSLHSSKSYLGALYRRLSHRKGPSTAIKAVARKLAVIFYKMVTEKTSFIKTEVESYNEIYKKKIINSLKKKAQRLGFELKVMTM
jgi:transposase